LDKQNKSSTVAKATSVAASYDRTRYDDFAITLHWLTAALVLAQFVLSQTWGFFDKPTRHLLIVTHMSFGILLTVVIVTRLVWRLVPGHQVSPADVGWLEIASKVAHYLLYVLLAAEAVLGFVLRWSGNEAMSFFGLLIPPPFAPFSREAHEWIGWTIVLLALAHAAAALFHQYVLRDSLLDRMLPRRA
jgi:cytochrome b561